MFAALHVYKIQDSPFIANNQYDKYDRRNNIFSSKLHSNYDIARKPYCPKTFLTCKTLRQRKSNLRSLDFQMGTNYKPTKTERQKDR